MRRGDIVLATLAGDYGKLRPTVVVQADAFSALESVVLCPITSHPSPAGLLRIMVHADGISGLDKGSTSMVEKVNAVSVHRCRDVIGHVTKEQLDQVDLGLELLLGVGSSA